MRTAFTAAAVLVLAAATAGAGAWRTDIWTGYGFIGMAQVNKDLDDLAGTVQSTLRSKFSDSSITAAADDKIHFGSLVGWDLGYRVTDQATLGLRVAQLTGQQGKITARYASGANSADVSVTRAVSLTPIMAGLDYTTSLNDDWDAMTAVYLGYGIARADYKATVRAAGAHTADTSFSVPLEGAGMVMNFQASALRRLSDRWYLGIGFNYLAAKIDKMKVTKDVADATTGLSFSKDATDTDSTGSTLPYDFSSGGLTLSLHYYF